MRATATVAIDSSATDPQVVRRHSWSTRSFGGRHGEAPTGSTDDVRRRPRTSRLPDAGRGRTGPRYRRRHRRREPVVQASRQLSRSRPPRNVEVAGSASRASRPLRRGQLVVVRSRRPTSRPGSQGSSRRCRWAGVIPVAPPARWTRRRRRDGVYVPPVTDRAAGTIESCSTIAEPGRDHGGWAQRWVEGRRRHRAICGAPTQDGRKSQRLPSRDDGPGFFAGQQRPGRLGLAVDEVVDDLDAHHHRVVGVADLVAPRPEPTAGEDLALGRATAGSWPGPGRGRASEPDTSTAPASAALTILCRPAPG